MMKRPDFSTGLLVAALLLALGTTAWSFRDGPAMRSRPARSIVTAPAAADTDAVAPARRAADWGAPGAQSHGKAWVYEVFTPPEIFYDATARRFTVTPPRSATTDALPAELELIAIERVPHRVQLVGYVGTAGDWLGAFEEGETGRVALAREGQRVPELAVRVLRLTVQRAPTMSGEGSPLSGGRMATAIVHDERNGDEMSLNSAERCYSGEVRAIVKAGAQRRELRQGAELELGEVVYRVNAIRAEPAELEVTRRARGANDGGESRTFSLNLNAGPAEPAGLISSTASP